MKSLIALAATGLLLTACSSEPAAPENTQQQQTIAPENNVAMKVAAMSEQERNVVMIRAIRDAGSDCQGVVKSEAYPDAGPNVWRAQCQSGEWHMVQIQPDGTANVTSRRD
ncbi:hypothetical protein [Stakelama pacifica]|uniref:Lipoprotein n=1 Tax=Stakelama pacifica TaxID=517720 RepID=A0A4V3BSE1_9SPHN|nr:hypothetical protein [Stakelama pacifica]MAX01123.1 hypothetical protein [Sphingomonas sp.]TDN79058.1 hypothetical protein EV664_11494 [Stakelama pacifica]GGO98722.1 hypothetical protein GCM10011329_30540 [Stakelama pacifica]